MNVRQLFFLLIVLLVATNCARDWKPLVPKLDPLATKEVKVKMYKKFKISKSGFPAWGYINFIQGYQKGCPYRYSEIKGLFALSSRKAKKLLKKGYYINRVGGLLLSEGLTFATIYAIEGDYGKIKIAGGAFVVGVIGLIWGNSKVNSGIREYNKNLEKKLQLKSGTSFFRNNHLNNLDSLVQKDVANEFAFSLALLKSKF